MYTSVKRLFDIFIALTLLTISLPFFIIIILLIKVSLGSPVFFTQIRPGKNCRPFKILKFRTMTDSRDINGKLLPNSQRISKLGNFLRHSSIDELPELFNVLKGDMSLVGPRPLLMDYLPLYTEYQNQRHKVKPGITGWAQVNGRNAITWNEKFLLDVWYIENRSISLDLEILFITIIKVLKQQGISHEGNVAMPRFTGN